MFWGIPVNKKWQKFLNIFYFNYKETFIREHFFLFWQQLAKNTRQLHVIVHKVDILPQESKLTTKKDISNYPHLKRPSFFSPKQDWKTHNNNSLKYSDWIAAEWRTEWKHLITPRRLKERRTHNDFSRLWAKVEWEKCKREYDHRDIAFWMTN